MKRTIASFLILIALTILVGCSKNQSDSNTVYGSWRSSDSEYVYVLEKDQTLYAFQYFDYGDMRSFDVGTFTFNDEKLILQLDGDSEIYEYEFFEKAMTLKKDSETLVLNRVDDMDVRYGDIGDGIYMDDRGSFLMFDGDRVLAIYVKNSTPSDYTEYRFSKDDSEISDLKIETAKNRKIFKAIRIGDILHLDNQDSFRKVETEKVDSQEDILGIWHNCEGQMSFSPTGEFYLYGEKIGSYRFEGKQLVMGYSGKEIEPECFTFNDGQTAFLVIPGLFQICGMTKFGMYGMFSQ